MIPTSKNRYTVTVEAPGIKHLHRFSDYLHASGFAQALEDVYNEAPALNIAVFDGQVECWSYSRKGAPNV